MKEFNYMGTCIPGKHYMVNNAAKLEPSINLIVQGKYLTLNYPRQFGKTTTLLLLEQELEKRGYLVLSLDFQGVGDAIFSKETHFVKAFAELMADALDRQNKELARFLLTRGAEITTLKDLSKLITELVEKTAQKPVLLIDEVDKSSNNQLFLSFLGMLREKYLRRNAGKDYTFLSVILAGVYDVKSLKLKIREGAERKYNSPWNIAIDYPADLAFTPAEIETMLADYCAEQNITMDIPAIAARLHYFTSGYPFLVSRLCALIAESIKQETDTGWPLDYVDQAIALILRENNTNFDSLIKNLENHQDLYQVVEELLLEDLELENNIRSSLIGLGHTLGVFSKTGSLLAIHNRIYKQILYDYMSLNLKLKQLLQKKISHYNPGSSFVLPDNSLDFEKLLLRFQAFMQEQYSPKDKDFVERNWRLLFLAFIKPVINGHGFDFKEAQVSEEKRLDVVITFYNRKYIAELKIWRGAEQHKQGIRQLADYLTRQNAEKGYLVIFDFKKTPACKQETVTVDGRDIFTVWV